jgi:hypothetical protein
MCDHCTQATLASPHRASATKAEPCSVSPSVLPIKIVTRSREVKRRSVLPRSVLASSVPSRYADLKVAPFTEQRPESPCR